MKSEPEMKSVSSNGRGKRYDQKFQKEAVRLLEAGRPAAKLASLPASWESPRGASGSGRSATALAEPKAPL